MGRNYEDFLKAVEVHDKQSNASTSSQVDQELPLVYFQDAKTEKPTWTQTPLIEAELPQ